MHFESLNGRGGEIRTRDPHNPIVVRYQAALRPDSCDPAKMPRGRNEGSGAGGGMVTEAAAAGKISV